MSHFAILVVGDDVESQMEPYYETSEGEYAEFNWCGEEVQEGWDALTPEEKDEYDSIDEYAYRYFGYEQNIDGEYGYYSNPNAKWDWYEIGGRWTGKLKLKKGATGEVGSPGILTPDAKEGYVDSAYKKDIDFEGMRDEAGEAAASRYDLYAPFITPDFVPWDKAREMFEDIDKAREFYHGQETKQKIKELKDGFWVEIEDYMCSKEEYVARARANACVTFGLLMDGEWYERGEMGWWAVVFKEKERDRWTEEFNKLLDSVSDDTLITVVDCHI